MNFWHTVVNDKWGNPRFVTHFFNFLKSGEETDYNLAFERAKKLGFKKYRGKDFGGGFVVTTYTPESLKKTIQNLYK